MAWAVRLALVCSLHRIWCARGAVACCWVRACGCRNLDRFAVCVFSIIRYRFVAFLDSFLINELGRSGWCRRLANNPEARGGGLDTVLTLDLVYFAQQRSVDRFTYEHLLLLDMFRHVSAGRSGRSFSSGIDKFLSRQKPPQVTFDIKIAALILRFLLCKN